jgi:hypothetical protein
MSAELGAHLAIFEFLWKRREIPCLHFKAPQLNALNILDLGELLVLTNFCDVKVAMFCSVVVFVLTLLHTTAYPVLSSNPGLADLSQHGTSGNNVVSHLQAEGHLANLNLASAVAQCNYATVNVNACLRPIKLVQF